MQTMRVGADQSNLAPSLQLPGSALVEPALVLQVVRLEEPGPISRRSSVVKKGGGRGSSAEDREWLDASADIGEVGLTEGETQGLLGGKG
jgi:hypothetical protein